MKNKNIGKGLSLFAFALGGVVGLTLTGCGGGDSSPASSPSSGTSSSLSEPDSPGSSSDSGSSYDSDSSYSSSPDSGSSSDTGGETVLEDITGVSFNSATYTYDGMVKTITVSGDVPSGVSVSYKNNSATDAGTYNATATLSGEGYNTLTLNATLTIEKTQITGISFSSASYEYDTFEHSIQIVGNVPSGSSVTYKYNGVETTGVTEVGTYTVVATITNKNYETLSLTAYLYITSKEELLYCANVGGTIYFQNNLDGNKLYTADGNGNVTKVSNDVPEYMISDGSSLYYYSTSLFSSTIKTLSSGVVSSIYSVNGEYLATDGTYVYYAVNNSLINTGNNGIYRYPLSSDNENEEPVRIVKDRAEYLTIVNGTIYYANPDDDDFLYSVSASSSNKTTGTLVQELETEDIITDGEDLYFNGSKNGIPASAVYKYDISSKTAIKLTIDSGKYLTVIGDYVYYVNSDWLTSILFGDGIYRVSTKSASDNNFTGEQIIENDSDGFSSLTGDGTYLYYYKLNDKHLYRYNISSKKETDLMANFTQDETYTVSGYSRTAVYNGETYFTDIKDGGCLYKYDPASKAVYKVLSDNVDWVAFNGDYMYYSAYIATVYSLYRVDMANNGQPEKIASGRYNHLIFEDGVIYYLKINAGNEDIGKMNLDGTESGVLFETDGDNIYPMSLVKEGNTFWFCSNPTVGYKYLWSYTLGDEAAVETGVRAETCASVDGSIYCYGSFRGSKTIKKYDPSSDSGETVCTLSATVNELLSDGSSLYFSADEGGICQLNVTSGALTELTDLEGSGLTIDGGYIYFVNTVMRYVEGGLYYPYHSTGATGDLYQLNISSKKATKLC